jgi:alanine dehydrogenase
MNIGVVRERNPFDRRVALTPPVVRRLTGAGHSVWVESCAGRRRHVSGYRVYARRRADCLFDGGGHAAAPTW